MYIVYNMFINYNMLMIAFLLGLEKKISALCTQTKAILEPLA